MAKANSRYLGHEVPGAGELYKGIDWKKIKKYGLPVAIAGAGTSLFFLVKSLLNDDHRNAGEEVMKNLNAQAAITETTEDMEKRGVGIPKKPALPSHGDEGLEGNEMSSDGLVKPNQVNKNILGSHNYNLKDEAKAKYADWNPEELSVETTRKVLVRDFKDYGLPENFKILRMDKVRDSEKLERIRAYFERMGYNDMKMVYHVTYSEHNEWHAIFYAGGEWGGMPYFKQKWEKSKR